MGRRQADAIPAMRLHKRSGHARVRFGIKEHYLGPWGSAQARIEYHRLLEAWLAKGRQNPAPEPLPCPAPPPPAPAVAIEPPPADITVGEVALRWIDHIEQTVPNYRKSSKWSQAIVAARAVDELRATPARDFGPRLLLAVQRRLVETPAIQPPPKKGEPERPPRFRSRRYVNDIVARVRQMFEWAMLHELVPEDRVVALARVPALVAGQTTAVEREPRDAVADEIVDATLPKLTPEVADVVMFIRLTGCRPSEAARMRLVDIVDRDRPVWRYVPTTHKTKHRGKTRHVPIGPKAQAIVLRHAIGRPEDASLFTPRRSVPPRKESPTIPIKPRKASPRVGDAFTKDAIRIAITRAVEKVNEARNKNGLPPLPHWTPYQLRYSRLQEIRRLDGPEAVQATAGHADARMSEHYAPPTWSEAAAAALRSG